MSRSKTGRKNVTRQMKQAIHLIIMDRWSSGDVSQKICSTLQVSKSQLAGWRRSYAFRGEFEHQLQLYRANFEDIQMADRKERVKALDDLYNKIPDNRVSLKVKVLAAIRAEVGDNKQVEHVHRLEQQVQGPNIPPRADSYEDWIKQNKQAVEAEVEVVDTTPEAADSPAYLPVHPNGDLDGEEDSGEEDSPFADPLAFLGGQQDSI